MQVQGKPRTIPPPSILHPSQEDMYPKSIKSFFATRPGLTAEHVQKFLPKSESTVKGHLKQPFKNIRSTQSSTPNIKQEPQKSDVLKFTKNDDNTKTHDVFFQCYGYERIIYTNQTGRYPITPSRNNKYIMIVYD